VFAVLVALLMAVMAVNVAVDPRGEFPGGSAAPSNTNDMVQKLWLLQRYPRTPDTIVVGSSRLQTWDPKQVAAQRGGTAFNFAVASSLPTDQVILYRELARRGLAPRTLLVGIDVEAMSKPPGTPSSMLRLVGIGGTVSADDYWQAALGSLDAQYFLESLQAAQDPEWALRPRADRVWFEADGLGHYGPWEAQIAAGTYQQEKYLKSLRNDTNVWTDHHPHPRQVEAVQALVRAAKGNGTDIVFVVTPIHPVRQAAFGPLYADFQREVDALLRRLCSPHVHVLDASDLARIGGSGDQFYDTVHETPPLAKLVVASTAWLPDECMATPSV